MTEDSAQDAHTTVVNLLKKTFGILVSGTGTHRIAFEPQSEREHRAMHGNRWKDRTLRELVDLRRTIATKLLEDEGEVPGFVAFHFDGDRPWNKRAEAENPALFDERIITPVKQLLTGKLTLAGREEELGRRMKRLLVIVPYYSIEAWLFQNIDALRQLCCGSAAHGELLAEWQTNRATLDETWKPKDTMFCVGSTHNATLSKGFPADEAFGAKASYAAVVEDLLQAGDLLAALERTLEFK
ncbi:MAG: hypothetical protein IPK82_43590 [Polyangiaceae bacterium]|nr:hypothetical protein [Polyangiaceae bacterium]